MVRTIFEIKIQKSQKSLNLAMVNKMKFEIKIQKS